ncbi:MAG: TRAP transporter small permease [Spirochaetota bacterium]
MTHRSVMGVVVQLYKLVLIVLVIVMFIVVGLNVFTRYVLNSSLGWADELARFLFIYVSLLGAVLAYQTNEHVSLDLVLVRIGNRRIQTALRVVSQLLIVIALGFFTFFSFEVATSARNVSPALDIPMSLVYGVMPFAGLVMFVMAILKFQPILQGHALSEDRQAEQEALETAEAMKEEAERLQRFLHGDETTQEGS